MAQNTTDVPKTQRAAIIAQFGRPIEVKNDFPVTQPSDLKPGECLVKLEYAGCCHSDVHIRDDDWGSSSMRSLSLPIVGGHEGIGKIIAIGEGTVPAVANPVKVGDRVGLKWFANACLKCEFCQTGWETGCTLAATRIHGLIMHGTFQEYAVSYTDYVTPIPEGLDVAEATPLLCAGLTVYRALKQTKTRAGQWVAIPGAGGGLGHLAVQFAVHQGLKVIAIDTGAEKKALCMKLGAEQWIDFKETEDLVNDIVQAAGGEGPHAAVIATGHPRPFNDALQYLRKTGTLVAVGVPGGGAELNVPIRLLIGKLLNIVGTLVGTQQDMEEVLKLAAAGKIRCKVDIRKLEDVNQVMDDLLAGNVQGRVVMKI
ncbi:NAD(P)-binding protein [Marasmius fiardii PR-910]|nr:NAD(P)-binding protein [Marasmius fiardii PR-910]